AVCAPTLPCRKHRCLYRPAHDGTICVSSSPLRPPRRSVRHRVQLCRRSRTSLQLHHPLLVARDRKERDSSFVMEYHSTISLCKMPSRCQVSLTKIPVKSPLPWFEHIQVV